MCGIIGVLNQTEHNSIEQSVLCGMLALIRHRGPDQFGIYLDESIGLGNARLSILDLVGGQQPITNEDGTLWIVYNGEIFNYVDLLPHLKTRGHVFTTSSDTEVILHLYEEYGPDCLSHLNGQFALAIWDSRKKSLFLARDRLGVRPLFYTLVNGVLVFGSEIKSLLAYPDCSSEIDLITLDQIFMYWSPLTPRTIFRGIQEVPPGHYMLVRDGKIQLEQYWSLQFPSDQRSQVQSKEKTKYPLETYLEEFRDLLIDATRIRLRADVPVGAYLSGGLDSSTVAAIIQNYCVNHLDTFSIAFSDPEFDESEFQLRMAKYLGTNHQVVYANHVDIGAVFPDVIWHTEVPILRTAPAPMFLLSKLVNDHKYKVVLTGEGADEFLGGYQIFQEAKVRRFWARQPESRLRPLLLKRLYPYIKSLTTSSDAYLAAFFGQGLNKVASPDYSHAIRWQTTSRAKRFFSSSVNQAIVDQVSLAPSIQYPPDFSTWDPLHQAQYLEITIFLSQYLLSSQGDRVAMAHSIEGRFPFLDTRVVEFCNNLPPDLKLHNLTEKYLLKKVARQWLPDEIWQRPKRPYRAPIQRSFFNDTKLDYVQELLSPRQIQESGFFKPGAVEQLAAKAEGNNPLSETDEMALVGIISTQLIYNQFVDDFKKPMPISDADDIKICQKLTINQGVYSGVTK